MTKKTAKTYKANLKVMGKTYKAQGKTPLEAISKLKTGVVAGTCVLTVSSNKNSKDRVLPQSIAKRAFMTKGLTREVQLKNLSLMFDNV